MNYQVLAQDTAALREPDNAPAISMGPYLLASGQIHLLTTISVYSERGATADQARLLYMNAPAMQIWLAMGRPGRAVAAMHRPPRTALLTYGVPFSE